jgi:hypothetical protein
VFLSRTATASVDVVFVSGGTSSFVFFATEPLDAVFVPGVTNRANAAAIAVAAAVPSFFSPGCASAVVNGPTATITLNNCTGPLDMIAATGTLTITYTDLGDGNGLAVTITSNQMLANNLTLVINESATINSVNGVRTANIHSESSGTNSRTVQVTGDSTLTWQRGSTCATQDGTFTTTVDGTAVAIDVTNLVRCAGTCPTGTIASAASGNRSLVVTLDGTGFATFVARDTDVHGTIALTCP